jgi:hypothetical protein
MALSNAERQKRYRERRKEQQQPAVRYRRAKDRRSRPQRWSDALDELRQLQEEYREWLENLPENLEGSVLHEKLEAICELDIDELDIELPLGFGRD